MMNYHSTKNKHLSILIRKKYRSCPRYICCTDNHQNNNKGKTSCTLSQLVGKRLFEKHVSRQFSMLKDDDFVVY